MVGVLSRGVFEIPYLRSLLGEDVTYLPFGVMNRKVDSIATWGRRPSSRRAESYARRYGINKLLRLEDGFIRSLAPGAASPSCSLVVDDVGIYYDATRPSRFEELASTPLHAGELVRAQHIMKLWRAAGVSKYNHAPPPIELPQEPYVLVIDQTADDASVKYGLADRSSFVRMLRAALDRYPDCRVVVKMHPEVALGRKKGYLNEALACAEFDRVIPLTSDVHVVPLLTRAVAVFTVTSQVGFEALLHGKPVHTFGMPFYAGWGLTDDALPRPGRRSPISVEQLAFSALVRYTRYVRLHTGERCEVEDAIDYISLQRKVRHQLPTRLHAVGFSRWKRPILRRFLHGSDVQFHRRLCTVPRNATVVQWGRRDTSARRDVSVVTVEDGFLRSVGLGAHLVRPVSWVFDSSGIYYDATSPSDLERLLLETDFDPTLLARAANLRESIVRAGVTKYNVGLGHWTRPAGVSRVVLVVGQVESDASLLYGAPTIRSNRALLEAVRSRAPDAYILYKPHPDVMAGLRGSREIEFELGKLSDECVYEYSMHQLIEAVDEVHVLTSLAGFEALLRRKPVTTYGLPFYAGWGLTRDHCHSERRNRVLTLDMLVAGALLLYPRYVSRHSAEGFSTPEQIVSELLAWKEEMPASAGLWRRALTPVLRLWATKRARRDMPTADERSLG